MTTPVVFPYQTVPGPVPILRHLMPPPGTVFDVWFPEANPGAAAAALEAILERKGVG